MFGISHQGLFIYLFYFIFLFTNYLSNYFHGHLILFFFNYYFHHILFSFSVKYVLTLQVGLLKVFIYY